MNLPPLPPRAPGDVEIGAVSVPPASAVPSIPVVSITPAADGGPHVLSLLPGAKIVAPALPRPTWRKIVDAVVVLAAIVVLGYWGKVAPSQIPALVGVLGTVVGYYFRRRKPQASATGAPLAPPGSSRGGGGDSLAPSAPPMGPPWP